MTIIATSARSSPLWQAILAAPWIGPAYHGWGIGRGRRTVQQPQPLVDLIERALDEWPIEAVDAVLDAYFGETGESGESDQCYEWQARQAREYVAPRTQRVCLLPMAPKPTGD